MLFGGFALLRNAASENRINDLGTHHGETKIFIFKKLESSPYVFLRYDAMGGPLQPQFDGPFKILKRDKKNYVIKINNRDVTVFIDRLKSAFIVSDDLETKTAESRNILIPVGQTNVRDENGTNNKDQTAEENTRNMYVTRSCRRVRFPNWYQAGFG